MKIKRYGNIYRRKRHIGRNLFVAVLICAILFFLGWTIGNAVGNLIQNAEDTSSTPSQVDSSNTSSQEDESGSDVSDSSSDNQNSSEIPSDEPTLSISENGIIVPPEILQDAAALNAFLDQAVAYGVHDIILEVKDEEGLLYYASSHRSAERLELISPNAVDMQAVVAAVEQRGLHPIAQIHCFMDHMATKLEDAGVLYSENHAWLWLDNSKDKGGKSWLNPYSDKAREYLEFIVNEVIDLGFDTVLLDSFRFPGGYQAQADFGEKSLTQSRSACLIEAAGELLEVAHSKNAKMLIAIGAEAYLGEKPDIYGDNPLLMPADGFVVDVMPKNFGNKLKIGDTTIEAPVKQPTETVTTILALLKQKNQNNLPLYPIVQGYTDTTIAANDNLTYTNVQLKAQLDALKSVDIQGAIIYNPKGDFQIFASVN